MCCDRLWEQHDLVLLALGLAERQHQLELLLAGVAPWYSCVFSWRGRPSVIDKEFGNGGMLPGTVCHISVYDCGMMAISIRG